MCIIRNLLNFSRPLFKIENDRGALTKYHRGWKWLFLTHPDFPHLAKPGIIFAGILFRPEMIIGFVGNPCSHKRTHPKRRIWGQKEAENSFGVATEQKNDYFEFLTILTFFELDKTWNILRDLTPAQNGSFCTTMLLHLYSVAPPFARYRLPELPNV